MRDFRRAWGLWHWGAEGSSWLRRSTVFAVQPRQLTTAHDVRSGVFDDSNIKITAWRLERD